MTIAELSNALKLTNKEEYLQDERKRVRLAGISFFDI